MHIRFPARPAAFKLTTSAALAALLALPCVAFSQVEAVTNQPVNLMAGPADDYPVITGLGPNQPVEVMGCLDNYDWCDVALDDLRGWVYGATLTYAYEGNYVPLQSYGAVIGLPVIGFSIDEYWGHYYHGRPWYGDRDRWRHEGPPGYPGGRPGQPQPNGGAPYPPRMQGEGQPVYRPNAGPVPHGAPPPEYGGRPPQQAPSQQQYGGRPPQQAPSQEYGGRPPQPAPSQQQYGGRPPQQAPSQEYGGRPPQQAPSQQQYGGRPPQQAPRPQPQPQAQPQGRGQPNEGRREPGQPQ